MLLKNCAWVVTQDASRKVLRDCDVLIDGSEIAEVGRDLDREGAVIECSGKVLLPGLVNAHTHLPMTLFRGYSDDMPLQDWLMDRIWPLEARLTEDLIYHGALLGSLELIKAGVTTFNDMYFFGGGVRKAVEASGVRAFFSQGILDYPTAEFGSADEAFGRFKKLVKLKTELFTPTLGTHAAYTCSDETLLKAKELARKHATLLHIHTAETRKEVYDSLKLHGRRPVEHLEDIGFLGEEATLAHAGWVTKGEVAILGRSGAKVAHCPVSNMKLAVGAVAPVPEMFREGVPVALGTDGAASNNCLDVFETMKVAALVHKMHRWDPRLLPAQRVLDMATLGGAEALGMKGKLGTIEPGKKADLILVDFKKPHLTPVHSVVSNLVYSARGSDVWATMVNGRMLMMNREVLTLEEGKVMEGASAAAGELAGGA